MRNASTHRLTATSEVERSVAIGAESFFVMAFALSFSFPTIAKESPGLGATTAEATATP
jgi:hypothetical protein|tara:strand:+ start:500 stop:676 length:177 start_codon:yes stop_codon:yes gene_type:complete